MNDDPTPTLRSIGRCFNDARHMRSATSELVGLRPDVLFTSGGYPLLVFMRATHTIPIVFTTVYDPIGSGFVTNLSHVKPVMLPPGWAWPVVARAREPMRHA